MRYRRLGASGVRVSTVGLGGNNFGPRIDQAQTTAVVQRALELGINFFDTADVYGRGASEQLLGKALEGHRGEVILATKVGLPMGDGPNDSGLSYGRIIAECEASLRRLGTDFVDLYYLHRPDPVTAPEETMRALDDLVRQGKVRYAGISNYRAWQACEMLWASDRRGYAPPVVTQDEYNMLLRRAESELFPFCRRHDLGVVAYFPLASSLLTGKFRRGEAIPTEVRGMRSPSIMPLLNATTFELIWRLDDFAQERGHNLAELAIAWLLSHAEVSAVIPGATKPEQVDANVAGCEWQLTAADLAELGNLLK